MSKKQEEDLEKQLEKDLTAWINSDRIISVANGYCSALSEIRNMIRNKKTRKEIEEYCDLHLNSREKIVKVKEDIKQNLGLGNVGKLLK